MKKTISTIIILLLAAGLAACQFSFGIPFQATDTPPATKPTAMPTMITRNDLPPIVTGDLWDTEAVLTNLYQRVSPGVVAIRTTFENGGGQGSGFVFDRQGHIVTNYHVVENAEKIEVSFSTGFKVRGEVIGTDLDSDLAVIKVNAPPEELHPLTLGNSDEVLVGQMVVAVGNPFGLSGTMTLGIVSAKGRSLESLRQSSTGGIFVAGDIIQTDASINPGNSGGPLLNINGEVIGINRSIRTTGITVTGDPINSGIGFAISINIVQRVVPVLIADGAYDYPFLGVSCLPELNLDIQEALGLPRTTGAYVTLITAGGPAEQAGLRSGTVPSGYLNLNLGGDLIIAADGRPVMAFSDLVGYLMTNKSPGDRITLTILRDNEEKEVVVTLGKRP